MAGCMNLSFEIQTEEGIQTGDEQTVLQDTFQTI